MSVHTANLLRSRGHLLRSRVLCGEGTEGAVERVL